MSTRALITHLWLARVDHVSIIDHRISNLTRANTCRGAGVTRVDMCQVRPVIEHVSARVDINTLLTTERSCIVTLLISCTKRGQRIIAHGNGEKVARFGYGQSAALDMPSAPKIRLSGLAAHCLTRVDTCLVRNSLFYGCRCCSAATAFSVETAVSAFNARDPFRCKLALAGSSAHFQVV